MPSWCPGCCHSSCRAWDLKKFEAAEKAYAKHRMPGTPEKDQIDKTLMVAAGVEIDGERGAGGPPRDRLLPLAFLSLRAATLRGMSMDLADVLSGTWTSALICRRPLMVLLNEMYGIRAPCRQQLVPFPRPAASESSQRVARGQKPKGGRGEPHRHRK